MLERRRGITPRSSPTAQQACAIVIPIYKPQLSTEETSSLERAVWVLGSHKMVFAYPSGMDTAAYAAEAPGAAFASFPAHCFSSVASYSRLLLGRDFYDRFADWPYILIYQLDAWVFIDALEEWCSRGYAYVGAPWYGVRSIGAGWRLSPRIAARMLAKGRLSHLVGNGGLSLRHVPSHIRMLERFPRVAGNWEENEDRFWSLFAPYSGARFRVPSWKEAAHFAVELRPSTVMTEAGVYVPFGCHAWEKYETEFWTARGVGTSPAQESEAD